MIENVIYKKDIESIIQYALNLRSRSLNQNVDKRKSVDFDSLFILFVKNKFGFDNIINMQYVWSLYSKSLKECKKGNMIVAKRLIDKGKSKLISAKFSSDENKYLQVYILPNIAYYEYKIGNYDLAIDLLIEGIKNITYIEEDYEDIHMAKIQQIHNIIRVKLKKCEYEDYIDYNIKLIVYLLERKEVNINFDLNPKVLKKCSKSIRNAFIYQILSEFLKNIRKIDALNEKLILDDLTCTLNSVDVYDNETKYFSNWLQCNKSIYNGKTKEVLLYLNSILKYKEPKYNIFNFITLQNLLRKYFMDRIPNDNYEKLLNFLS